MRFFFILYDVIIYFNNSPSSNKISYTYPCPKSLSKIIIPLKVTISPTATFSVVVTVNANYYNILNISLCNGDSVFAGGAYQLASGTFYDSFPSIDGCDSVIETILTISFTSYI